MSELRVITRKQQLSFLAKKQRWAQAVYFFSGVVLAPPSLPHYQTSSSTITDSTLFVCHQTRKRS